MSLLARENTSYDQMDRCLWEQDWCAVREAQMRALICPLTVMRSPQHSHSRIGFEST